MPYNIIIYNEWTLYLRLKVFGLHSIYRDIIIIII